MVIPMQEYGYEWTVLAAYAGILMVLTKPVGLYLLQVLDVIKAKCGPFDRKGGVSVYVFLNGVDYPARRIAAVIYLVPVEI